MSSLALNAKQRKKLNSGGCKLNEDITRRLLMFYFHKRTIIPLISDHSTNRNKYQ